MRFFKQFFVRQAFDFLQNFRLVGVTPQYKHALLEIGVYRNYVASFRACCREISLSLTMHGSHVARLLFAFLIAMVFLAMRD